MLIIVNLQMKNNTINKKEIEIFKIAEEWESNGKFKPLHKFNLIKFLYKRKYY